MADATAKASEATKRRRLAPDDRGDRTERSCDDVRDDDDDQTDRNDDASTERPPKRLMRPRRRRRLRQRRPAP
eukprot:1566366-Pyramimonas_sp.AAC.1